MKKDLKYLNSKWWYRLVKVIFVLVVLIVITIYNFTVFSEEGFKRIDQDKTSIQCLYKDNRSFSPKSIDISLSKSDLDNGRFDYKKYYEGYNEYAIRAILKGCYDKDVSDVYSMQKWYELHLQDKTTITQAEYAPIKNIENTFIASDKTKQLDYSFQFFNVNPVFSYKTGLLLILINFGILLFFEVARRVFYYIVLGTFVPERKREE